MYCHCWLCNFKMEPLAQVIWRNLKIITLAYDPCVYPTAEKRL